MSENYHGPCVLRNLSSWKMNLSETGVRQASTFVTQARPNKEVIDVLMNTKSVIPTLTRRQTPSANDWTSFSRKESVPMRRLSSFMPLQARTIPSAILWIFQSDYYEQIFFSKSNTEDIIKIWVVHCRLVSKPRQRLKGIRTIANFVSGMLNDKLLARSSYLNTNNSSTTASVRAPRMICSNCDWCEFWIYTFHKVMLRHI